MEDERDAPPTGAASGGAAHASMGGLGRGARRVPVLDEEAFSRGVALRHGGVVWFCEFFL